MAETPRQGNGTTRRGDLRLGVVHYHWRGGGVYTVVMNQLQGLIAAGVYERIHIELISCDGDGPRGRALIGELTEWAQQHSWQQRFTIRGHSLAEMGYRDKPWPGREQLLVEADELAGKLLTIMTTAVPGEKGQAARGTPKRFQAPVSGKKGRGSLSQAEAADAPPPASSGEPFVLHCHNGNLGKNPLVTAALRLLADRLAGESLPGWLLYQVHDFAEDQRPDCWRTLSHASGTVDRSLARWMMYPTGRRVLWATINSADRQRLASAGIPAERIVVVPNAVPVEAFSQGPIWQHTGQEGLQNASSGDLTQRLSDYAAENGFRYEPERRLLLGPYKILRRKNVTEAVLLLCLLNAREDRWQLVVTLPPASPGDCDYARALEAFVRRHGLPVVFHTGQALLEGGARRVIRAGRVERFAVVDMLALAEAVVTTSVQEGFGYVFHEPWLADRLVVGRDIPRVTADFRENGLQLDHLYSSLVIPWPWIAEAWPGIRDAYIERITRAYGDFGLTAPPPEQLARELERAKIIRPTTADAPATSTGLAAGTSSGQQPTHPSTPAATNAGTHRGTNGETDRGTSGETNRGTDCGTGGETDREATSGIDRGATSGTGWKSNGGTERGIDYASLPAELQLSILEGLLAGRYSWSALRAINPAGEVIRDWFPRQADGIIRRNHKAVCRGYHARTAGERLSALFEGETATALSDSTGATGANSQAVAPHKTIVIDNTPVFRDCLCCHGFTLLR